MNGIWENILSVALANGLWSALCVCLLVYVLKDARKREECYKEVEKKSQETIKSLAQSLKEVHEVKRQTAEIIRVLNEHKIECRAKSPESSRKRS